MLKRRGFSGSPLRHAGRISIAANRKYLRVVADLSRVVRDRAHPAGQRRLYRMGKESIAFRLGPLPQSWLLPAALRIS